MKEGYLSGHLGFLGQLKDTPDMHYRGPNDVESIGKKPLTFHAGYSCLTIYGHPPLDIYWLVQY